MRLSCVVGHNIIEAELRRYLFVTHRVNNEPITIQHRLKEAQGTKRSQMQLKGSSKETHGHCKT